jgi:hypothetical protein
MRYVSYNEGFTILGRIGTVFFSALYSPTLAWLMDAWVAVEVTAGEKYLT